MWRSLHDAWWRLATQDNPHTLPDRLACGALQAGATAFRAAVAARNAAYDRGWVRPARLPCRVISVGNLTVGGTGKTACVELIARELLALGRRVAILSRGYGGAARSYWLRWERGRLVVGKLGTATNLRLDTTVSDHKLVAVPNFLADEPQLLARHLDGVPVVVGSQRARAGRLACREFNAETLILDDGFQHRQLARDCDIVLVHARTPFGGGAVFPRGPMREPLASLRRADIIMVTKADEALGTLAALGERLQAFNRAALLVTAVHEPASVTDGTTGEVSDPQRLSGLRVGLVSSIGDPAGFEATIRRLQATVAWHLTFPDHHPYRQADWDALARQATTSRQDAVVTTEKDWVRLQPLAEAAQPYPVPFLIMGIQMTLLSGAQEFHARLARLHAG